MRHAYGFFCDDIRAEVGNKISLMGLYTGEMHISRQETPGGLPWGIPKLCVAAYMDVPVNEPIRSLQLTLKRGDETLQDIVVPPAEIQQIIAAAVAKNDPDDPIRVVVINMNVVLAPYMIEKNHVLDMLVIADGVTYRAAKLRVKITDPASTASSGA
ncbi:hypothetical protein [Cupriavidus pampae]|uniref:Uncharacterized protein n=1 Tax=Cupriavidus pampae TaxID=659251 RepID=A0ABN7YWG5_9BURK|nr:hypothetical protein [Cupriavidus pampae]CAG9177814.1 hypothetical protein LMG32289_03915 [Cupriavidus pampae]